MTFRLLVGAVVALLLAGMLPAAANVPVLDPRRGVMTMAPLLERATPTVVNIAVATRRPQADNPLMEDPFFRRFFQMPDQPPPRRGLNSGSGVIVDAARGYVLTNAHVVAGADQVAVTLVDRRTVEARIVGLDPETDIAVLQIGANGLDDLPLGDSDDLLVGDLVVAIGNPFGLGQTVTSGIISALGRSGIGDGRYQDFIQTDAPINPGNSGGPLVNTKGEIIGINSAILAPTGGNIGIGFAVPINMAKAVMEQLIRYGEVRRGRIGVTIQDLTPPLAAELGVAVEAGAVIGEVEPDSPAARAGLSRGMVITAVDGVPVATAAQLSNAIGLVERGREVRLTIEDGDRRHTVDLPVEAR